MQWSRQIDADPTLGREMAARGRILDQLDRGQQAAGPDLADQRVIGEPGQRVGEIGAERPARALVQALLGDDPQVLERHRRGHRMAGLGEAVRPLAAGLDQGVADPAADQHARRSAGSRTTRPLAAVMMSGVMPNRSQPHQRPVRPKPQITSSAISSTSCWRQMRSISCQ